jgi:hypothetical protein
VYESIGDGTSSDSGGAYMGFANGRFSSNQNNYMHPNFFLVCQIMNKTKLLKISIE